MDDMTTRRHRSRRLVAVPMLLLAIVALAGPAAAKEGAEAQLDTPIDLGAEPGTMIHVGWNVVRVDGEYRRPMTGLAIFIRLVPPAIGVAAALGGGVAARLTGRRSIGQRV